MQKTFPANEALGVQKVRILDKLTLTLILSQQNKQPQERSESSNFVFNHEAQKEEREHALCLDLKIRLDERTYMKY